MNLVHLPPWISAACAAISVIGGGFSYFYSDINLQMELDRYKRRVANLEDNFKTLNTNHQTTVGDIDRQFELLNKGSQKSQPRDIPVPLIGSSPIAECAPGEYLTAFQIQSIGLNNLSITARVSYTCSGLPSLRLPRR